MSSKTRPKSESVLGEEFRKCKAPSLGKPKKRDVAFQEIVRLGVARGTRFRMCIFRCRMEQRDAEKQLRAHAAERPHVHGLVVAFVAQEQIWGAALRCTKSHHFAFRRRPWRRLLTKSLLRAGQPSAPKVTDHNLEYAAPWADAAAEQRETTFAAEQRETKPLGPRGRRREILGAHQQVGCETSSSRIRETVRISSQRLRGLVEGKGLRLDA